MLVIVIVSVGGMVVVVGPRLVELRLDDGSSSSTAGVVGMVHTETRLAIFIICVQRLNVLVRYISI